MKSPERVLVVDASIAGAAGPDPKERPWSDHAKDAHDVLEAIRTCERYRVAFDDKLQREWKDHQGRTAQRWLAAMLGASRVKLTGHTDTAWIDELVRDELPDQDQEVALKDSHLVALADDPGDERVVSNDAHAREKFARLSDMRVQRIHWVAASEKSRRWLLDGADDRPEWRLGVEAESA